MQFQWIATMEIPGFIRSQVVQTGYFTLFQEIKDGGSARTVPTKARPFDPIRKSFGTNLPLCEAANATLQ